MRLFRLIFLVLALLGMEGKGNACPEDLKKFSQTIGYDTRATYLTLVRCSDLITSRGYEVAGLLIGNLHEIDTKKLKRGVGTPAEQKVIWSLFALSYITGGQWFRAKASPDLWKLPDENQEFLLLDGRDRVPFFATRMSTGSRFVAPLQEQRIIIKQWKEWYKFHARDYKYFAEVGVFQY